jgi:hypothetical protein
MDIIQEGYNHARKKIYTTPNAVVPPDQNALPPLTSDAEKPTTRHTMISSAEVANQIERFRILLREKDGEIFKLKHETILLKQVILVLFLNNL